MQFAGIAHLIAEENASPAAAGEPLFCSMRLRIVCRWRKNIGELLNRSPSVLRLATQLFPAGTGTAGLLLFRNLPFILAARVLALQDAAGRPVSTVGAYAMANGEAYMAMGETLPELRGRGIGGWLIPYPANELVGEGWTVTFLCGRALPLFYERLGFVPQKQYVKYKL